VFERVSGIHHERLTQRVILDSESEVHRILIQHDKLLPERIASFLLCHPRRTFLCDVISSQLDADRLDYLLRDNLMTGSRYGSYDLRWLLHSMTVDEESDRLAVNWKGVSAVEAYLQARYHMYRNVYFHKVVRAAEGMLRLALQRAQSLAGGAPHQQDNEVQKALLGQRLSMQEFRELDDISILHAFKTWSTSADAILAGLCRGLLFRGVYKTIDLSRHEPVRAREMFEAARAAIASGGGDGTYDIFYDEIADTPYEKYDPQEGDVSSEILVCDPDGSVREFASISPVTEALNRELIIRRIHLNARWKETAEKALAAR
jgi:HD superfamily phosphohydrolase